MNDTPDQPIARTCPVCQGPLSGRRQYCSDKCRRLAYWEKLAARIADEVRDTVYKKLIEKLVK